MSHRFPSEFKCDIFFNSCDITISNKKQQKITENQEQVLFSWPRLWINMFIDTNMNQH